MSDTACRRILLSLLMLVALLALVAVIAYILLERVDNGEAAGYGGAPAGVAARQGFSAGQAEFGRLEDRGGGWDGTQH